MKKSLVVLLAALIAPVLVLGSCDDGSTGGGNENGGGTSSLVEMVTVPGGSFQMGSNDSLDYGANPAHTVTLSGFYMGKYPVTQAQYQEVIGSNPSYFTSNSASGEVQEKRPVERVSWYDAIEFCNALSVKEGLSPYYTINKSQKDPNNTNNDNDPLKWTVTPNSS